MVGRLRAALGLALALAAFGGHGAELHFRTPSGLPSAFGAGLLDADERAFLAALPTVRVGVVDTPPYQVIGADGAVSGIHATPASAMRCASRSIRPARSASC